MMHRLSVVIPNYNYAEFVGTAIQSALDLDWPDVEVVVVDDGSTDGSVEIISGFAPSVRWVQQINAGPREACNRGFAMTTGDVVIFLDSDDRLHPTIGKELAAVWRTGVSKVQVQMRRVDAAGDVVGPPFPRYRATPSPRSIRVWMTKTSAYPTPPGSGNAYSREFLDRLFPLDGRCGDATDSACLAAAPFLGDVVTIAKPLVDYRTHGRNRSYLLGGPDRFSKQLHRAHQRHDYAQELGAEPSSLAPLFRGRHLLQLRVAEFRLSPGRSTLPGDTGTRMLMDCFRNIAAPGPEGLSFRLGVAGWCLATLLAPARLAHHLIRRRFRQS